MRYFRTGCMAVMLVLAGCAREREAPLLFPGAPVILISIDTLRADHLPAWGYRGVATPAIDRFRRDAVLFADARAHVPLTLPSHVSLLTGELPPRNGVRNNIGFHFDASKHPTIPGILRRQGYATGAAVSAYVLRASTGLGAAFDFFDDGIPLQGGIPEGQLQRRGVETVKVANGWIDAHRKQPFFFLLHLFEPHTPYEPTYDSDIAAADRAVGEFLDHLRAAGVYDQAVIILLSDHGEGLGDHGEAEHGILLYRETLHVPLILKLPRQQRAGTMVRNPAQLIDVFSTVARLTGASREGTSLLELDDRPPRSSYAETLYPRIHLGWSALRSLTSERWHFVDAPSAELYDLRRDEGEKRNIAAAERRIANGMREEVAAFGDLNALPSAIDPEEAARLSALGYLRGTSNAAGPLPDPKERIGDLAAMRRAEALAQQGQLDESMVELRGVVARNPNFTDAWSLLGEVEEQAGEHGAAIDSYRRAIGLSPTLAADLALSIASALMELGRYDEADRTASAVENTNANGARLALARIALARGDFNAAAGHARAALSDRTVAPAAGVLLAEALTGAGRFAEAASALAAAQRAAGGRSVEELEFARGDLLARTDRVAQAEQAFRAEIAAFPGHGRAYASLAVLLWVRGNRSGARAILEQYMHAAPAPSSIELAAKTIAALGDPATAAEWRKKKKSPGANAGASIIH